MTEPTRKSSTIEEVRFVYVTAGRLKSYTGGEGVNSEVLSSTDSSLKTGVAGGIGGGCLFQERRR